MTFEEFQKSGRDVESLGAAVGGCYEDEDMPGRVYAGDLVIEKTSTGWNDSKLWNNLADLERELYEFGISEEILT
jgi:hypothetical protein